MATAHIEPPDGSWGTRQILATALTRLGYHVEVSGAGEMWRLLLS